jgi:DNA-binding response OmpR family regulator
LDRTVLIVEDEANIAEALGFLLQREGWTVHIHPTGEGVLEMVEQVSPVLVVLDVMLPVRSGLDVLADLRANAATASLPVLMLTARGQVRDRDQAEKAGVSRYMTKPFSNQEVITAVRDLVAVG